METEQLKVKVLDYLRHKQLAVIATASIKGEPEAATIGYFIDDNFDFYFITRRQSRKFKNLIENRMAAIVVGTELAPTTVQMQGTAHLLEDGKEELEKKLKNNPDIEAIYFYTGPFSKLKGMDYAMFKVVPYWLRWMDLDLETGEEKYHQLFS